jgi:hypothetical protein
MAVTPKRSISLRNPGDQDMRDQEVFRANRELAAYFRGRRTEREARAALKIIKAFIRERERTDPARRRPLPGFKGQSSTDRGIKKPKTPVQKARRPKRRSQPAESQTVNNPPPFTTGADSGPVSDDE